MRISGEHLAIIVASATGAAFLALALLIGAVVAVRWLRHGECSERLQAACWFALTALAIGAGRAWLVLGVETGHWRCEVDPHWIYGVAVFNAISIIGVVGMLAMLIGARAGIAIGAGVAVAAAGLHLI